MNNIQSRLAKLASEAQLDVKDGKVRRSSSRFCLGVEHGDYNGTELFGVGTDRFIWLAYKPNQTRRARLMSGNFPDDGMVEWEIGTPPAAVSLRDSWGRFPCGVDFVLQRAGVRCQQGFDAVVYGNIPGGGMSRSASLTLNLILTFLDVNDIPFPNGMQIVRWAQEVENDFIGSPCGILDQLMIYFAKAGRGTHYRPADETVSHVPLGETPLDVRIVSLDTGTDRPGLEKSTYALRRRECEELVELAGSRFAMQHLAEVTTLEHLEKIRDAYRSSHPHLIRRLDYIYHAQQRFGDMLAAWQAGDWKTVGRIFRQDGIGLRDDYQISGPELESMCDIARTVEGVLGERMLGGGDKGAAGAIVLASSVPLLEAAVARAYPRSHPDQADRFAVHSCQMVDGITELPGL